jgi:hypothetical protein
VTGVQTCALPIYDGSPATCSSQDVAGVEVDYCVAGPDAPTYGDAPRLGVESGVGAGLG